MKYLFALFPLLAFATVNEPLRLEWLTGYRTDNIHWHATQDASGALYDEDYPNVQFWENLLSFHVIYRDLTFFLSGGYSTFGRGTLTQRFNSAPTFTFNTSGFAADGTGYFGYAVNLTADRVYKVLLIPLVGFSGHFVELDRNGSASDGTQTSTMPKHLEQTWYGFYLGGSFRVQPVGRLVFDVGYAYHFLHAKLSSHFQEEFATFTQASSLRASSGGNHGHSGWAKLECIANAAWRVGAAATINYFPSNVLSVSQKTTTTPPGTTASLPLKFKLRWTSVSVLFTISRDL